MTYEEAYGRAWRKLAKEEDHRKGAPRSPSVNGHTRHADLDERRSKVARLTRQGMTARQIATQIGTSPKLVRNDRRALGMEGL